MIDPVLQQMLAAMAASGFALPEPMTATSMRAALNNPMPKPPVEVAEVRDVTVSGAAGPIAARLYHPAPGTVLPLVVMLHGGGWVIGTLDTHDGLSRILARDSGCAVLSLDYRLAPEHPFPAPLDDCLAAIAELPSRAAEFGVRADRYGVTGDSAGGNLAAAVALALKGKPNAPAAQVLLYPVIDSDFDTPSYRNLGEAGAMLTTGMMRFFWNAYVGDEDPHHLAAPLRAEDVSGLAPATIILAGNDPLHDEGFAYAVKLREAGVPTDLHDFSGGIHGFASFFGVAPIADQAVALAAGALKRLHG
ncbi:alpha/beta hydrolase [Sphingomonas jatrophae]|uniref:Acetyl esterase n=1 Tax=Sphingomonas jatrophae TaxID=1166337 RepID=A0A1I6KIU2_9SPHN|nr:alpha/beta hydrolase [Sphingomonas jatrophae]SFR91159.1 acetyl esterase [Sphingomonas jatrophae]